MTALETFTTASKRPLTTGRRPDMTAICAEASPSPGDACRGASRPRRLLTPQKGDGVLRQRDYYFLLRVNSEAPFAPFATAQIPPFVVEQDPAAIARDDRPDPA